MSAQIISLRPITPRHGIIHIMGDAGQGFEVGHESASGGSWGWFSGPYATGRAAIEAARALNLSQMGGRCEVAICAAALAEGGPAHER